MRAIEITQFGGPEVLVLCERPMPVPKAGEVLIKVSAAGVNRPDVFQRTGNYPVPPGASDLPGLEVAGEIVGGDLDGRPFRFVTDPPFEHDVQLRVPDTRKARDVLGFEATTSLETMLDEVIPWIRTELDAGRL